VYFACYMIVSCCQSRYAPLPNVYVRACFFMVVIMEIGEFYLVSPFLNHSLTLLRCPGFLVLESYLLACLCPNDALA
jgi:hypothetical protein